MKVIIIGIGKIGYVLAKQLSQEGHDIVAIDRNPAVLHKAQEKLDIAVVNGNGASAEVQREAGVSDADILVAVASSDEINLLCSLVAHKLGCRNVIARVRNPEYDRQMSLLDENIGLSFSVNPEKTAAYEIFHLIQFSSFQKRDLFASGRAEAVEFKLSAESQLADKTLNKLGDVFKQKAIVCTVERNGRVTIPSGSFTLLPDDRVTIASAAADLPALARSLGIKRRKIDHVMIVGGSKIAEYLAKLIIDTKISVTIIEQSIERCNELSEILPLATVICGNGTDQDLLIDEGIEEADAVVTLTGMDEENLLVSMFANYIGVPKTITKINRLEFSDVFTGMGIDTFVSPKLLTANEIIRYVRAVSVSREGGVETLYRIANGSAEALGFTVPKTGRFLNTPLSQLPIKPNILLAIIIRGRRVIIPKGNDCMQAGDSIIIIADSKRALANLTDIFEINEDE